VADARVALLHVEQELLDLPAVRLAGVRALGHVRREVAEVAVQRDLLLGHVAQGLRPRDEVLALAALGERTDGGVEVLRHLGHVALEEVHQRRLRLVVEVVAREELVGAQVLGVRLQQIAAEHAAVGAGGHVLGVVLDHVVHADAQLVLVAHHLVAHLQIGGQLLARLQRLVAVPLDPLVDGEGDQLDPRVRGERLVEDRREDDAVLPAGEADHPALGVFGRRVVGEQIVLADATADAALDRLHKVRLTEVCSRVGGVHHRVGAAPVAVHYRRVAAARAYPFRTDGVAALVGQVSADLVSM